MPMSGRMFPDAIRLLGRIGESRSVRIGSGYWAGCQMRSAASSSVSLSRLVRFCSRELVRFDELVRASE
jgi:hypothetical protein